jgi:hypothetical protein
LLACAPCLAAVGFRVAGDRPRASADGSVRPALAFDQYAVNLGAVPPSRTVQAFFRFRNTGRETVRITKIDPSCGCLKPRLERREFGPGEVGRFFLVTDTAGQDSGPQEFWATVHYTDPQPRQTKLLFKVDLPEERVTLTPRALIFYQGGGRPTEKTVLLNDFRERPLRIVSVGCDADYVSARLGETTENEAGRQVGVVVTVAAKVPAGTHTALVRITTDDPIYKTLAIPVRVSSR